MWLNALTMFGILLLSLGFYRHVALIADENTKTSLVYLFITLILFVNWRSK